MIENDYISFVITVIVIAFVLKEHFLNEKIIANSVKYSNIIQKFYFIKFSNSDFGTAPTTLFTTSPFFTTIKVGIDMTLY